MVFRSAVALESTCDYAYWQRADFLLQRWYGEEGKWEAWLDRAVAPLPPTDAGPARRFTLPRRAES